MIIGLTEQFSFSNLIFWILLSLVFILILPKYLFYKMIAEMELVVETFAGYTKESAGLVKKVAKKRGKNRSDPTSKIERIMEFFLIQPVNLDPYGILKKLEYVIDEAEDRFERVSSEIAPKADKIWKANVNSLLKGTIGLHMLTKMLRHYVEFAKKTGNMQIAMIIHMQLPLLKKIAKAQLEGVKSISKGKPIGDGIGPLAAANLMTSDSFKNPAKDVVYSTTELKGRKVHVLKADGPGASLGKLGDAVKKTASKNKVKKIITIDASVKMEGEVTGTVSEGVGAAIGDPGPEKAKIEEVAMELKIPLEAVVVKMSVEEAISPLTRNISASVKKVIKFIEDSVGLLNEKDEVLIVGVGNTCGVGNSKSEIKGMRFPKPEEKEEKRGLLDRFVKWLATPPKPPEEGKKDSRRSKKRKNFIN